MTIIVILRKTLEEARTVSLQTNYQQSCLDNCTNNDFMFTIQFEEVIYQSILEVEARSIFETGSKNTLISRSERYQLRTASVL